MFAKLRHLLRYTTEQRHRLTFNMTTKEVGVSVILTSGLVFFEKVQFWVDCIGWWGGALVVFHQHNGIFIETRNWNFWTSQNSSLTEIWKDENWVNISPCWLKSNCVYFLLYEIQNVGECTKYTWIIVYDETFWKAHYSTGSKSQLI